MSCAQCGARTAVPILFLEKGDRLLSLAADGLLVYEVSFGSIKPKGGGMMVNSCKPHQNREAFLSLLAQDGISVASKRHLPKPVLTGVKEAARRVFAASGMLDNVTRFVRKVKRGRSGR